MKNKCKNCIKNCCGSQFRGMSDAYRSKNELVFCQILLDEKEYLDIKSLGGQLSWQKGWNLLYKTQQG